MEKTADNATVTSILRAGRTDSLTVALLLKKRHCDVLRDIERLDCTAEFRRTHFGGGYYISEQNKIMQQVVMTATGFGYLLLGYNGKRFAAIKEEYLRLLLEREEVQQEPKTERTRGTRRASARRAKKQKYRKKVRNTK